MATNKIWVGFGLGLFLAATITTLGSAADAMVIHEWGTFTSLQNERGEAIGGINTDDEPVPRFVHRLANFLLLSPTEVPPIFFQGAPRCHPDVTMRLETPVIYFHPSPSQKIQLLDVHVSFKGGWLSEYFPDAIADAPGLKKGDFQFGPLTTDTVSKLDWNNLQVGVDGQGPYTKEHVWTSPRAVNAASVGTSNGEKEKFLFYRGVAHQEAPLRVLREKNELTFRSQWEGGAPLAVEKSWLVDIKRDGRVAFRELPKMSLAADHEKVLATTSAEFAPADFSSENLSKLKDTLREALVRDGLFKDEADALLNTWELSYFKSAGLRVFFLVPRPWTDAVLPLEFSMKANVDRVMVGRIELITPEQRALLRNLAAQPVLTVTNDVSLFQSNFYGAISSSGGARPGGFDLESLNKGAKTLSQSHVPVPASYQLYLSLGRFRNALVLDEQKRRPSAVLDAFIRQYRLEAYVPK